MAEDTRVTYRTCPLCEATCGLEVTSRGEEIVRIRGDREDVFSEGFICPKGSTLGHLDADPDRLRLPRVRDGAGFREASWDEAFALVAARLGPIIAEHGPNAVALYLGNPNVHNMAGVIYNRVLARALRSRAVFSAATVDQMPKHVSSGLMFGHPDLIAVPDVDRTDFLLMLGANPFESNGSLATAPDWPGRITKLIARGGRLVVVDPRRTKTAMAASEHLMIRPGTDALLLAAIAHVLFDEDLVEPGRLTESIRGMDEAAAAVGRFSPERVATVTAIDAATIRRLARELAAAPTAAVYGRIGTHTVEHGTVASWLVDLLNVVTGNLDEPGGAMFARAAHEQPRHSRGWDIGRWSSRVSGHPEVRGEFPAAAMAEEIETPGEGQIRAMVTVAGNPVLSTPNGARLDAALETLEFMVAVDLYQNETTRHADVILPATSPLRRAHYDFAFYQLSVRNVANYSPPLFPSENGNPAEWQILLRLSAIVSGQGADLPIGTVDEFVFGTYLQGALGKAEAAVAGLDPAHVMELLGGRRGPERYLDFMLRTGPYGDHFGLRPDGLTLAALEAAPHGIDLGPLEPRFPRDLATPDLRIDAAPDTIVEDLPRLEAMLHEGLDGHLLLVGRRHVRSNNSWMHNIEVLVKGKERCTLEIHPRDALASGVEAGATARVTSAAGVLEAVAAVTEDIMPGVVSLPHGWGHGGDGVELSVASRRPGVNSNLLSDEHRIDPLSGNAVLNAIPVTVEPIAG